jgi:GGDEF domain-containing protein
VGGDDFIVIVPPRQAERVASALAERFDARVPDLYPPDAAARGYIEVEDRLGVRVRFPLLSVSIGVASTANRWWPPR